MASIARGDGPSGFSLEASLMAPWMPSSRSSSSMGLPGTYGSRPRTPLAARRPKLRFLAIGSLEDCLGIGTKHPEEIGLASQLGERLGDGRILRVPVQVEEKYVMPLAPA